MEPSKARAIREKYGLTQQQVAQIFGYSRADAISDFEIGRREIKNQAEALYQYLDLYGPLPPQSKNPA